MLCQTIPYIPWAIHDQTICVYSEENVNVQCIMLQLKLQSCILGCHSLLWRLTLSVASHRMGDSKSIFMMKLPILNPALAPWLCAMTHIHLHFLCRVTQACINQVLSHRLGTIYTINSIYYFLNYWENQHRTEGINGKV